ncbi:ABC transporter substrate-binding protein [Pelagibius litoralis]|uniref:ABC transporter substrate-binding protein n=1 Tax=Pelagibius litoralis TaxID=374515 RepID=A0A967CAX6_9PROT|nr:ABC transporter substrate-binding protein [Pelagibius litoralis]NIA67754.1 ABC transporter substrate-binding protein [Pelagibius litoralis]
MYSGFRLGAMIVASFGFFTALAAAVSAEITVYQAPEAPKVQALKETPSLAPMVNAGQLPKVQDRLPQVPRVSVSGPKLSVGKHGGELRMLVTRDKDVRLLNVYGYARLVGYNEALEVEPDLLERLDVEDGRIFTLKLREGHRWSDGHPFTSEDFRYFWEDVANNEALNPAGPSQVLRVEGELPEVEFLDETTIRYTWSKPNPFLIPALAGARPLDLFVPAHYLKAFHPAHGVQAEIDKAVKAAGARNWAQLHNRIGNMYKATNPDLPTLQPWHNGVKPPSTRFVAERNPYYHRIDASGQQLPYADRFVLSVVGGALVPAKTSAGEADLQSRGLHFSDYTFLKAAEKRSGFDVRLWKTVRGSQLALYPNMNVNDPAWRKLNRDARFRRALSLAINRSEINQVIYYGLTLEGNNSVLPDSPLYKEEYRAAWADFDIKKANALLDEVGLTERNDSGIRLLPDGRPAEIIIETAGENTEEVDVLELISDSWKAVGVSLFTKPSQREVLRNRIFAGETMMAMWFGYENGIPTPYTSPEEFVPIHQQSYHWPKWGQYAETAGKAGEAVDMEKPERLMALYGDWLNAKSKEQKTAAWEEILEIHADEVYTIGLVAHVPQPVTVANSLRNVPEEGIYNWDPGAQFGIYRPERFWFDR